MAINKSIRIRNRASKMNPPHYIYIEQPNEIFIDLESTYNIEKRWLKRLPQLKSNPNVKQIISTVSRSGKQHRIIVLEKSIPELERLAIRIACGDDLYRSIYSLMRNQRFGENFYTHSVLIETELVPNFRDCDSDCNCDWYTTKKCEELLALRGEDDTLSSWPSLLTPL